MGNTKRKENKPSIKSLIMVIISALIIVILGIVIAYALNQEEVIEEKEDKISILQKKVNNLTDYVEKFQASVNKLDEKIDESNTFIEYINDDYGFNLELPENWSSYKTEGRTLNFGSGRSADSVDFYFDDNSLIFNIGIIEKEMWESVKDLSYYQATKLGENGEYVFGYVIPGKADFSLVESLQSEINIIKESFSLVSNINTEDNLDDTMIDDDLPVEKVLDDSVDGSSVEDPMEDLELE